MVTGSYRDALWPETEAGKFVFLKDLASDGIHPNDMGQAYCAAFATDVLNIILV